MSESKDTTEAADGQSSLTDVLERVAAKMACGASVTNVYEAYEAGRKAERAAWLQQAKTVRNYSAPDDVFEAVPVRVMGNERPNVELTGGASAPSSDRRERG